MSIPIIYQDNDLLIIDKPNYLLSVPGKGAGKADNIRHRLEKQYSHIREVHRLDWATSGLMMLALHKDAHRALSQQFEQRKVQKIYQALVAGDIEDKPFLIDLPLRCDWENRPRQIVDFVLGKPSQTNVQKVKYYHHIQASLVNLYPITGRSHQLRVHMMAAGYPILGDELYAPHHIATVAPHLMLHACGLTFEQPTSKDIIQVVAPAHRVMSFIEEKNKI